MGEKNKIVWLAAILLIVIVLEAYYIYTLNMQVNDLKKQNAGLDSQVTYLKAQLNSCQDTVASRENEISALRHQLNSVNQQLSEYQAIANLQKTDIIIDHEQYNLPAGYYVEYTIPADYPGYITVVIHSATTQNINVRVQWSYNGIYYEDTIQVGAYGQASFPVLPGQVTVDIINTNILNGATVEFSIIYHY